MGDLREWGKTSGEVKFGPAAASCIKSIKEKREEMKKSQKKGKKVRGCDSLQ